MWKKHFLYRVLMDAAAGDGGAAGGGAAGTASGDANAAPGANGAGGDPSVLAAAAAAASAPNFDYLPEKYRVIKEDGSVDAESSHKKLAEAHSAMEARLGSGDVRPKEVSDYAVTVPDAFKEAIDPKTDAGMQAFLKDAHAAGFTQKQVDLAINKYFEFAPGLAAGAQALDAKGATEALQKVWNTPEEMNKNVKLAYSAADTIAKQAGMSVDEIMNSPLGNDPTFIRLMAAIGPEFQEDPGLGAGGVAPGESREDLMRSEAYTNSKHKDHARVSEKVRRLYEKEYGTAPAA